jgi:hypothetical protein
MTMFLKLGQTAQVLRSTSSRLASRPAIGAGLVCVRCSEPLTVTAPMVCSTSIPRSAHGAQRVSSFSGPKLLLNGRRPRSENMTCALNAFRLSCNACSTERFEETAVDWRSIILEIFSLLLTAERQSFANRASVPGSDLFR